MDQENKYKGGEFHWSIFAVVYKCFRALCIFWSIYVAIYFARKFIKKLSSLKANLINR